MKILDHPYTIKFHESYETMEHEFYVIELVEGDDLFKFVSRKEYLDEYSASCIMAQVFEAVRYIHRTGLIHRDLKPENIMLEMKENSPDELKQVKIIDFGFACYVEELKDKKEACGTPDYVAPEVYLGQDYDQKCDIFSLGVILFFLIRGELPFHNDVPEILTRNIIEGDYEMEADEFFNKVSEECKDLIGKMLQTDPNERICIEEALAHPWIVKREKLKALRRKGRFT